jgi:hypothetical protein
MTKSVYFNIYKLKKGSSVPDFLLAADKLFSDIKAKHNGCAMFALLLDGETWADYSIWETMDDLKAFEAAAQAEVGELADKFYSFLNFSSCVSRKFTIERSYGFDNAHFAAPNVISYHSYGLNRDVAAQDFLVAADKMNNEFICKHKGWLSSKNFTDGKNWADLVIFDAQENLTVFAEACESYESADDGVSYMDCGNLKSYTFSVEYVVGD